MINIFHIVAMWIGGNNHSTTKPPALNHDNWRHQRGRELAKQIQALTEENKLLRKITQPIYRRSIHNYNKWTFNRNKRTTLNYEQALEALRKYGEKFPFED